MYVIHMLICTVYAVFLCTISVGEDLGSEKNSTRDTSCGKHKQRREIHE